MIQTERLTISEFAESDADFILRLVNTETWLKNIGDKKVHTIEDAKSYLLNGPMKSYKDVGYGLWKVSMTLEGDAIGMCGLVNRGTLPHPDIGFALLPEFEGKGYGIEAAKATMDYGSNKLGVQKVVAITDSNNLSSQKLLQKLGMRYTKNVRMSTGGEELMYFE